MAISNTHLTPPSSTTNISPSPMGLRPTLPNRQVTSTTIEDAYVNFILYCNPAVPLETDTTALRESFRTPPKSDGKSFSSFTLFELIQQLENKELKTWAELALKLGVTPPDQEKGQSSQKIQQYAVRLKRWMHSMHVNAFFDYLNGNTHPYFNQIPTDPNPICEEGRDGVAAEDDMALRALLPQIRPRRGRRKPEDDSLNKSPSQRPRLGSPAFSGEPGLSRPEGRGSWTAHPDGRPAFLFPPTDQTRSSILPGSDSAYPWSSDTQTPLSAYPHSAMTPINARTFWSDPSEPRSAITPSKARLLGRRHGAKVVSSAWRSGGSTANGKTRGRPPTSRPHEQALSTLSTLSEPKQVPRTAASELDTPLSAQPPTTPVPLFSAAPTSAGPTPAQSTASQPSRTARLGLSLQVPERVGGSVRLATPPPPVVMVNGESTTHNESTQMLDSRESMDTAGTSASVDLLNQNGNFLFSAGNGSGQMPHGIDDEDPTNVAEIESLLVSELLVGDWYDAEGNKIPPCGFEEALAITKSIIGTMSKQAPTPEAFLFNLAALAGGSILMRGIKVSIVRLEEGPTHNKYTCRWIWRYSALKGNFSLTESVAHNQWKKKSKDDKESDISDCLSSDGTEQGDAAAAEHWKKKYQDLLSNVRTNHQQSVDLKIKVLESFKNAPPVE